MKVRFLFLSAFAALLFLVGCQGAQNLPPAERLMHPGPGVDGPGPGVLPPSYPTPTDMPVEGALPMEGELPIEAGEYGNMMGGHASLVSQRSSQVLFAKPEMMHVHWDVTGDGHFDSSPLICPGRQNFSQGAIYRLKLTNIPGREGVELYPTLEVGPVTPRTEAFLAHNAIPVQFTEQDFDQVLTGNFVTKVIYLPDRDFQEMAVAGVETLVSTRLDPSLDPIVEADRRGAILAIIRLGNIDPELPGTDADAGSVIRARYEADGEHPQSFNTGGPAPYGGAMPPGYGPRMPMPQYGMAQTGTPIGLPGPPHIPLGGQAGLKRHVMVNHTRQNLPDPTSKLRMDVAQRPGFSYPKPANNVMIIDKSYGRQFPFHQPLGDRVHHVNDADTYGEGPSQ